MTGGSDALDADFTSWVYWWGLNRDPYLLLKDAVNAAVPASGSEEVYLGPTRMRPARDSMAPSETTKRDVILPALKKAIDSTDNNDIASSCMIAMAKVGRNRDDFTLREVFLPRLKSPVQEISETAALALGIAALPEQESVEALLALAGDTAAGRALCDRAQVNERTQSFAIYGLGLIAHTNADLALKRHIFAALRHHVDDGTATSRNVMVAAINAIGVLDASPASADGRALIDEALQCLRDYYQKSLGAGAQLLQAHVPPAVVKLLGRDHPDAELVARWKQTFLDDLADATRDRRGRDLARSCVLALGQLCAPVTDDKGADAAICARLLDVAHSHKDAQTRYFAMLALGQIGGAWNRTLLLRGFDKAGESLEKPWFAMALGVLAFRERERALAHDQTPLPDEDIGRALRQALTDVKDPIAQSAFAVALGLCHYQPAGEELRTLLARSKSKADLAGYVCIGLALMGDQDAVGDITTLVAASQRKPELLKQAAIALGKLGDKRVADQLQRMLVDAPDLAALAAIASAIGFIGDARSIEPLRQVLADEHLPALSRAFAAVALGGVGDKERLPWGSKIAANMNYRAAVETLIGNGAGILDIL
jgi:HEAT repeat protein